MEQNKLKSIEKFYPITYISYKMKNLSNLILLENEDILFTSKNCITIIDRIEYKKKLSFIAGKKPINFITQISNKKIISTFNDFLIQIFELSNNNTNYNNFQTLNFHENKINIIIEINDFSLISCDKNFKMAIWNIDKFTNKYLFNFNLEEEGNIISCIELPNNEIVSYITNSSNEKNYINFWNIKQKKIFKKIKVDKYYYSKIFLLKKHLKILFIILAEYILLVNYEKKEIIKNIELNNIIAFCEINNGHILFERQYIFDLYQYQYFFEEYDFIEGEFVYIAKKRNIKKNLFNFLLTISNNSFATANIFGLIQIWKR